MKRVVQQFREHFAVRKKTEGALSALRFLGPGLLVTVGFIDPGNWASNVAAGSEYGYQLLWVVTLGTLMLIVLQHNAAHLGIVTGYCLAESATLHLSPWWSRPALATAVMASAATAFAESWEAPLRCRCCFTSP